MSRGYLAIFGIATGVAAASLCAGTAVAGVTDPVDLSDAIVNLGSPSSTRYPTQYYPRNVWDLKAFEGRLYIGSGNSANEGPNQNAGPVDILSYNPTTGVYTNELTIAQEQIDIFRILDDGGLYIAGHDPRGASVSSVYRRATSANGWETFQKLTGAEHAYDLAVFDGKLIVSGNEIWISSDTNPANLTKMSSYSISGRRYTMFAFPNALYAVGTATAGGTVGTKNYAESFGIDRLPKGGSFAAVNNAGNKFVSIADRQYVFPGVDLQPTEACSAYRSLVFGSRVIYLGVKPWNDHQGLPLAAFSATDGASYFTAEKIDLPSGAVPWDTLKINDKAYLLWTTKSGDRFVNHVSESADGLAFTELFSFTADSFARSFEYLGGRFYFGLGTETADIFDLTAAASTAYLNAASGTILSCPYDLSFPPGEQPNRLLNLPPAPKGGRFTRLTDLVWPANVGEADICLWADDKMAACSVTIDDNCVPDHDWWLEKAAQYGIKLTWFVVTGGIKPSGGFDGSWADWQRVVDAGHSVQSHTTNHKATAVERDTDPDFEFTEEELTVMYRDSLAVINANVTNNLACTIAYPYGEAYTNVSARYAIACRGVSGEMNGANTVNYLNTCKGSFEPYYIDMILYGATSDTNAPAFIANSTTSKRGWITPLSHFVNAKNNPTSSDLALLDSWLRNMGDHRDILWLGSFDEVAKYGQERDTATLTVTENAADHISFTLTDRMLDTFFTFPLTVKVRVPDSWEDVAATQDDASVPARIVTHDDHKYALVNAVPDRGLVMLVDATPLPPPHDHVWGEWVTNSAPTCTVAGKRKRTCTLDGCTTPVAAEVESVPALGHIEVIDPYVAPTETETGLTEGSHCSRCGAVLVKQKAIPAIGVFGQIANGTQFFNQITNGASATFELINDIDLGEAGYTTLASFAGTIKGNGHTLTGIGVQPLFTDFSGTISNVVINGNGTTITADGTAAICCNSYGAKFVDVVVTGYTIKHAAASKASGNGLFVGTAYDGTEFVRCATENSTVSLNGNVNNHNGGFVGVIRANLTGQTVASFADCTNNAEIAQQGSYINSYGGGGFVGYASFADAEIPKLIFRRCVNNGTVSMNGGGEIGGFVGILSGGNSKVIGNRALFLDCVNNGTISATGGDSAGGILGCGSSAASALFDRCVNRGTISASGAANAGGICGSFGGTMSAIDGASDCTLVNCANYANVSGNNAAGLLAKCETNTGWASGVYRVDNCANYGTITGTTYAKELVGYFCSAKSGCGSDNCFGLTSGSGPEIASGMTFTTANYQYQDSTLSDLNTIAADNDRYEPWVKGPTGHPELAFLVSGSDDPGDEPGGDDPVPGGGEIENGEQFVNQITANPAGEFTLIDDIDLSTVSYTTIANFSGTLIGQGHTITGFGSQPLFNVFSGTIRNVKIDGNGATIAALKAGVICTESHGGSFEDVVIGNVTIRANVSFGSGSVGLFVGLAYEGTSFLRCETLANATAKDSGNPNNNAGGFVGRALNSVSTNDTVVSFADCTNRAAVAFSGGDNSSQHGAGGFIGNVEFTISVNTDIPVITFSRCFNHGTVTANHKGAVGGFVGRNSITAKNGLSTQVVYGRLIFADCVNQGALTGTGYASATCTAAGFVGSNSASILEFNRCANRAQVAIDNSGNTGGFVGYLGAKLGNISASFLDCANYGDVSGVISGGFIAKYSGNIYNPNGFTVKNCANYGAISGSEGLFGEIGGQIEYVRNNFAIDNLMIGETLWGSMTYNGTEPVSANVHTTNDVGYAAETAKTALNTVASANSWGTWVVNDGRPELKIFCAGGSSDPEPYDPPVIDYNNGGFEIAEGNLTLKIASPVQNAWYTLFTADTLTDTFKAVESLQYTGGDAPSFEIPTTGASKFATIGISNSQIPLNTPLE